MKIQYKIIQLSITVAQVARDAFRRNLSEMATSLHLFCIFPQVMLNIQLQRPINVRIPEVTSMLITKILNLRLSSY